MVKTRRRGTAIVETRKGILIGKDLNDGRYQLIGGNANKGESRHDAAIRELWEETHLDTIISKELFSFQTKNNLGTTLHKAILIKAKGVLNMKSNYTAYSPNKELECIGFFNLKDLNNPKPSRYQGQIYACLKPYINNGYRKANKNKYFSKGIKFI